MLPPDKGARERAEAQKVRQTSGTGTPPFGEQLSEEDPDAKPRIWRVLQQAKSEVELLVALEQHDLARGKVYKAVAKGRLICAGKARKTQGFTSFVQHC